MREQKFLNFKNVPLKHGNKNKQQNKWNQAKDETIFHHWSSAEDFMLKWSLRWDDLKSRILFQVAKTSGLGGFVTHNLY